MTIPCTCWDDCGRDVLEKIKALESQVAANAVALVEDVIELISPYEGVDFQVQVERPYSFQENCDEVAFQFNLPDGRKTRGSIELWNAELFYGIGTMDHSGFLSRMDFAEFKQLLAQLPSYEADRALNLSVLATARQLIVDHDEWIKKGPNAALYQAKKNLKLTSYDKRPFYSDKADWFMGKALMETNLVKPPHFTFGFEREVPRETSLALIDRAAALLQMERNGVAWKEWIAGEIPDHDTFIELRYGKYQAGRLDGIAEGELQGIRLTLQYIAERLMRSDEPLKTIEVLRMQPDEIVDFDPTV